MDVTVKQDFDTASEGPVNETIELLKESLHPGEYKAQLDELSSAIPEQGYQEITLDNCSYVYVVGDVHARPNELALALGSIEEASEKRNSSLDNDLRDGKVALLFVGDYVHAEKNVGDYWQAVEQKDRKKIAEENLNTVIGILNLKKNYPNAVLTVQGNHDMGATHPQMVAKNGTDQGNMLKNVLESHNLAESTQNLLNRLPLVSVLNIREKKIVLSHALPLPEGGYAEAIRLIDNSKLPFTGDQAISAYIRGKWGDTIQEVKEKIQKKDPNLARLLTWSKLQSPTAGVANVLSLGEKTRLPEDLLSSKSKQFVQDYLYLLAKHLFAYNDSGKVTKPSDILWLVGHESVAGIRNMVNSLGSDRLKEKGIKIFQVNDYTKLPVLGMNISNWDDVDFISDNRVKKF